MPSSRRWIAAIWMAALAASLGCLHDRGATGRHDIADYSARALEVEFADLEECDGEPSVQSGPPRTIRDLGSIEHWDMPLQEAILLALTHSKLMRDLGGTVLRSPDAVQTSLDPAIQESDPRFGVEGTLSAFDAQLDVNYFGERIDRRFNNRFLGNLGILDGDRHQIEAQVSKRAVTGSRFALRHHIDFEKDNSPANEFPDGIFNVWLEAEARHPLLQGSGLTYNRIAGPDATAGLFNGVLIARTRTDISLAEFESALRDFLSDVENAYWDLYYSYRELDARERARDTALVTWRRVQALFEAGRRGGEAEKEAQAREQYFRFEADLQDALAGRPLDGTRTNNGSRPGPFRALPGVLVNEHRLRLIIGMPATDCRLIRPADEPGVAPVCFDWNCASSEALALRTELRRQRWQVKRRELEFIAARNLLLPRLDLTGIYRWRGFGDNLLDPDREGNARFDNAYQDLTTGDFQEWQAGVDFSMPLGFRQAHAGVRNAELRLARERVLMHEQERQIVNDLSLAIAEVDRALTLVQLNYNRRIAAFQQLASVEAAFGDDKTDFFTVLDAQRRLVEAESQYYRSRSEYAVAVKNVHFEKGTLLQYSGVIMAEGPWADKAYYDAARRAMTRGRPMKYTGPAPIISRGLSPTPVRLPEVAHEIHAVPLVQANGEGGEGEGAEQARDGN